MHVLLCNERLLFRYGHDRVLALLGRHLHEAGHTVTVLANHYDQDSVAGWADRVIEVTGAPDYAQNNDAAKTALEQHWTEWFGPAGNPEYPAVAIVGGWPFFRCIEPLEQRGVRTIYFDCGAVPIDGMSGGELSIQMLLRKLRRENLPHASCIVANSEFTERSQSLVDAPQVPSRAILLGADHLERALWQTADGGSTPRRYLSQRIDGLAADAPLILCPGRFEPDNYKNGRALFGIMERVIARHPTAKALILAEPEQVEVPPTLRDAIVPIGFPSDGELQELMGRATLGLVPSLWEGFGLPLAEMQWLGRPVLVFGGHAHDEVVAHPSYLCSTEEEMADKACAILDGDPLATLPTADLERWRKHFRWERTLEEWREVVESVGLRGTRIVMDVTNAAVDPANTGVIRVTRQLARELRDRAEVLFVRWSEEHATYVFPTAGEYDLLGGFHGPRRNDADQVSTDAQRTLLTDHLDASPRRRTWLCIAETIRAPVLDRAIELAEQREWQVAAVFHDAIPILHPEWVLDPEIRANHADYMRGLAQCDLILPNSAYSGSCLQDFWTSEGIAPVPVHPVLLAGQLGESRSTPTTTGAKATVDLLCVSTLELRKNHERLLDACTALIERRPELSWRLRLVGNRSGGAEPLYQKVLDTAAAHDPIEYLGVVDDAELERLLAEADFTVYPSLTEGFGVPIVESLAFGTPCLCSNDGVMVELAADGGCLTVDVRSVEALSKAIEKLITDHELRARLAEAARSRPVRTWADYAAEFCSRLARVSPVEPTDEAVDFEHSLYRRPPHPGDAMTHAERLALSGVLAHRQPTCVIDWGAGHVTELLWMTEHCGVLLGLGGTLGKAETWRRDNLSVLPGGARLDELLAALEAPLEAGSAEFQPEFVLLRTAPVKPDDLTTQIRSVIDHVERTAADGRRKAPLWLAVHDTVDPRRRKALRGFDWSRSPHVHCVDLDWAPQHAARRGRGIALIGLGASARDGDVARLADGRSARPDAHTTQAST